MAQGYFTQAFNFGSAAQGGVDPRTGLFMPMLPLAKLVGNGNLGPVATLSLQYDPLSNDDMGLGLGMSLGLSTFDSDGDASLVNLSTGERFKVQQVDGTLQLRQQKLDSVRFVQDDLNNAYTVIHKSGDVEVLTGPMNGDRYKVPQKLYTAAGRSMTVEWRRDLGEMLRLDSIADETDSLLSINYDSPSAPVITIWPGTPEEHQFTFHIPEQQTVSVTLSAGELACAWTFDYDAACGALYRVTSPMGRVQTATYDPQGTAFPDNGLDQPPLPRVTKYTDDPGRGPATVRDYEYTTNNYLGYGQSGQGSADDDYLYGVLSGYTYGSTVTTKSGTDTRVLRYTYNSYHLLTRESVEQNDKTRATDIEYYALKGQDFVHQPAQFQLHKSVTVTWTDKSGSRQEVTTTQFDEAGNPISTVMPDGTTMTAVYYDAAGEGDDCPADPHGFVRYLKSETLTPGVPSAAGFDDAPTRKTEHQYKMVTTTTAPSSSYLVVRKQSTWKVNDVVMQVRHICYDEASDSANFSRISSMQDDVYAADGSGGFQTTTHKFTFSVADSTLVQDVHWSCNADGLSASTQRRQSRFSGRLEGETDAASHTLDRTYDAFGRLLGVTESADTPHQRQISYTHEVWGHGQVTATLTDPWGNQITQHADGLGRHYQTDYTPAGSTGGAQQIELITHDSWGRTTALRQFDVNDADGQSQQIVARAAPTYDDWGGVSSVTDPNGAVSVHRYDPVTNTATVTKEAKGLTFGCMCITYDDAHRPVQFTLYNSDGTEYATQSMCYDGLGQLRKSTDALGHVLLHDYDPFGRLATTTYEDGTSLCYTYADFTAEALLSSVAIAPKDGAPIILGTQTFDSLGRLTSRQSSSGTTIFQYDGAAPMPSQVTAAGKTLSYSYEPRPGWPVLSVDADDVNQTFQYDSATGALTELAETGSATRSPSYARDGRLSSEATLYTDAEAAGGTAAQAQYAFSLCGRPATLTGIDGNATTYGYDATGRLSSISAAGVNVSISYDAAGRTNCWAASDETGICLTTVLAYDDFGRESSRQIFEYTGQLQDACVAAASSGTSLQVINTTFDVMDRITDKVTLTADGAERLDHYEYHPIYGYLTTYSCVGNPAPSNAYGMVFTAQVFTFDAVGSVLTCTTTHADGSADLASFFHDADDDPARLTSVSHTHPAYPPLISLEGHYDAAGRLTQDEAGRPLAYDALGRLVSAGECEYQYDASDRLVLQSWGDQQRELYYCAELLMNERQRGNGETAQLIRLRRYLVAQRNSTGTRHLGTDVAGSVILQRSEDGSTVYPVYGPHGEEALVPSEDSADHNFGFNGERRDPVMSGYHLGNGYRMYNPTLMRFMAPDDWSPLGAGGHNAFAYCSGDSINYFDPTGHWKFNIFGWHLKLSTWDLVGIAIAAVCLLVVAPICFGLALGATTALGVAVGVTVVALGAVSDATSIAATLVAGSGTSPKLQHTAHILNWVSMGTGLPAVGESAVGFVKVAQLSSRVGMQTIPFYKSLVKTVVSASGDFTKAPPVHDLLTDVMNWSMPDWHYSGPASLFEPKLPKGLTGGAQQRSHIDNGAGGGANRSAGASPSGGHAPTSAGSSASNAGSAAPAGGGEHTGGGESASAHAAQRIEAFSMHSAHGGASQSGLPPAPVTAVYCRPIEAFIHEFGAHIGGSPTDGCLSINAAYLRGPRTPLHKVGHGS